MRSVHLAVEAVKKFEIDHDYHSTSEPRSGSDRVKLGADSACDDRDPFQFWLVKTILGCHPRLTRSLPLLGSDVEWYPGPILIFHSCGSGWVLLTLAHTAVMSDFYQAGK